MTSKQTTRDNAAKAATVAQADTLTPADRYQDLFIAVQMNRVFDDGKTFVDCAPRAAPEHVLAVYRKQCDQPGFDLAAFVHQHFIQPQVPNSHYTSPPGQSLQAHIDGLWDVFTRHPHEHPANSSLLPLPQAYVVPGGRFSELYYWDSYFTMLGLAASGRRDLLGSMANNFAYLIDTFGHVPNGNRTYYLSRSQPPVFALMVELFEQHGVGAAVEYLPQLRQEYAWWMDGADALRADEANRRCVRLSDGALLNRYWDDRDTPREESHREDVITARKSSRPAHEVYRDLRAGAASGWDFSSRWCDDAGDLASIRTTAILPVDLNCLLYKLERQIALLSDASGDPLQAQRFRLRADARHAAIDRWLWSEAAGAYLDFDWHRATPRSALTTATATPLFVGVASRAQAQRTSEALRARLLDAGGIGTSEHASGEQWDRPNGWAPLQWLAIRGLRNYEQHALADTIAQRWLHTVSSLYQREGKLVEKYVLVAQGDGAVGGSGGEYPLQDGFGWTNGVTRQLLHDDPASQAHHTRAPSR